MTTQVSHLWTQTWREEAKDLWSKTERPTLRNPNYKFTSLQALEFPECEKPASASVSAVADVSLHSSTGFHSKTVKQGVSIFSFDELIQNEVFFRKYAQASEKMKEDFFYRLVAAKAEQGLQLEVTKSNRSNKDGVSEPFHTQYIFDENSRAFYFYNVIVVKEGASFSWIEEAVSQAPFESSVVAGFVKVVVESGAELNWFQLQDFSAQAKAFVRYDVELGQNAKITHKALCLGGKQSQTRQQVNLLGRGSDYRSLTAVYGSERQHFDFWISSYHRASPNYAEMELRCVADDASRCVFNGMIEIPQGVNQSEAHQKSTSLLLSPRASVDTMPKLEIATDDVKVSHGASVSSIDEDQLFYMQARGLTRAEAEEMIVQGFANSVIDSFPTEQWQQKLRQRMQQKANEVGGKG